MKKESDWITSIGLEGSAWSQPGDEGLGGVLIGDQGGQQANQGRLLGARGRVKRPRQKGRDDRWRLTGGWSGERCGGTCAWGWVVSGVVSSLCQGGRKSAGQVWGLGVGWSAEAVSWQD